MTSITKLFESQAGIVSQKLGQKQRISPENLGLTNASPSFLELMKETGASALQSLKKSETLTHQAALGLEMDSQKVALGVLNAAFATRQLTSILSTAIPAFKEIQHMQI